MQLLGSSANPVHVRRIAAGRFDSVLHEAKLGSVIWEEGGRRMPECAYFETVHSVPRGLEKVGASLRQV